MSSSSFGWDNGRPSADGTNTLSTQSGERVSLRSRAETRVLALQHADGWTVVIVGPDGAVVSSGTGKTGKEAEQAAFEPVA